MFEFLAGSGAVLQNQTSALKHQTLPASTNAPHSRNAQPDAALNQRTRGSIFSSATMIVRTAIHKMFITPTTNNSAINAQQQPAQNAPCSSPIPKAPRQPSRQRVIINSSGARHRVKQLFFSGVNWNTPAISNNDPASVALELVIIGESNATLCSVHWASAAMRLNTHQIVR